MTSIKESIKKIIYLLSLGVYKLKLEKYETERRNMLIGTVRSREQLEINLKNNFYYMPLSYAFGLEKCYDYIALYQSATIFGKETGILYYGEVKDIKLVRRDEIREIPKASKEKYIRFSVDWKKRDEKLKSDFYVKTFIETSYDIFKTAKNVSELYIKSYEEYKLYEFMKNNFVNTKILATDSGIYEIKSDSFKIELGNFKAAFFDNDKKIFEITRHRLKKNIESVLAKLEYIKKEKNTDKIN